MSKNETCAHGKVAPLSTLRKLHDSQAGIGRHKCTNCAYEKGFTAGALGTVNSEQSEKCNAGSAAPISVLQALPHSQAGIGRHKCTNCAYQKGYDDGLSAQRVEPDQSRLLTDIAANSFPDVDYETMTVKEGSRQWVQHFSRERRPEIVTAKKVHVLKTTGRLKCEACEFDFTERYGAIGEGFCEVHHTVPLSSLKEQSETKLEDLAILCSNCHRMIHRTKPMSSVNEFKTIIRQANASAKEERRQPHSQALSQK
jgi:5-methylcytosine-specific restriction endonuclease McrA